MLRHIGFRDSTPIVTAGGDAVTILSEIRENSKVLRYADFDAKISDLRSLKSQGVRLKSDKAPDLIAGVNQKINCYFTGKCHGIMFENNSQLRANSFGIMVPCNGKNRDDSVSRQENFNEFKNDKAWKIAVDELTLKDAILMAIGIEQLDPQLAITSSSIRSTARRIFPEISKNLTIDNINKVVMQDPETFESTGTSIGSRKIAIKEGVHYMTFDEYEKLKNSTELALVKISKRLKNYKCRSAYCSGVHYVSGSINMDVIPLREKCNGSHDIRRKYFGDCFQQGKQYKLSAGIFQKDYIKENLALRLADCDFKSTIHANSSQEVLEKHFKLLLNSINQFGKVKWKSGNASILIEAVDARRTAQIHEMIKALGFKVVALKPGSKRFQFVLHLDLLDKLKLVSRFKDVGSEHLYRFSRVKKVTLVDEDMIVLNKGDVLFVAGNVII